MAEPIYFNIESFAKYLGRPNAETLFRMFQRVGGDQTITTTLLNVDTSITEINATVEGDKDNAPAYLRAEVDDLRRRLKQLEAMIDVCNIPHG